MFLGIDVGTSSVKAIIVDAQDREIASATAPLGIDRPKPHWSEQDPDAWWRATVAVMDQLAAASADAMSSVRAIGMSGQMLGVTLLDAADKPIRPALLWNDGRASAECRDLAAQVPDFVEQTGCRPMPGFSAPKILWLSRHEPEAIKRARLIVLPKDYVRLQLGGEAVTDLSDGSATLLMDTRRGVWSEGIARACGVEPDHLPRAVESGSIGSELKAELASRWKLPRSLPIAGGAGDNMCGAVGAGVVTSGDAVISLGTSGVYFVANDRFVPARGRGLHTHRHAVRGLFGQQGCVLSAAAALSWLMNLVKADSAEAFLDEIEAADFASGDIPVFSPYLTGERTPHDNPEASAAFSNLRAGMGATHLGRAVLEGVAFSLADCQDALLAAGAPIQRVTLVGGGARSRLWAQIIANAINRPLTVHANAALGPALGAARLARQAVGGELIPASYESEENLISPQVADLEGMMARRRIHGRHHAAFVSTGAP